MTAFTGVLLGEHSGGQYVGFDGRRIDRLDNLVVVLGNIGFLYNLRTGVLHVRIISNLKGKTSAPEAE